MIIIINVIDIDFDSMVLIYEICGILDDRQRSKSKEVHFQKSKFLDGRHDKLCRDCSVGRPRQWNILIHRFL